MKINSEEFLWVEAYRPRTVSDTILPDRLKNSFLEYVKRGEIPHLLLSGTAGVGKTTVARAMCEEIGLNYLFINASEERGIELLRNKIRNYASTVSLTGGKKCIILDEADALTPDAQNALKGAFEEYASNCSFILTCNFKSKLIDAIHSRTSVIDFKLSGEEKSKMAMLFFKRLGAILDQEKVSYQKPVLVKIVEKYFPDYRRTLNELQRLATNGTGTIDESVLANVSDLRNVNELFGFLKEKNFTGVRKWVVENGDVDATRIYRRIYDSLYSHFDASSIPQAVLIIAKYQYQAAFVADQEINLVSCLTEIMVDCSFL